LKYSFAATVKGKAKGRR